MLMKKESKALRAKRVGITSTVVFAMILSTLFVIPPASTVIAQEDIGGEYGGDFRVALNEVPNTFNPLSTSINDAAMQVIDLLYDSLGRVKADSLMLEPWVAKEWTVDPDNERNVTVILREDVLWHDGTALTATDVDYTFGASGYDIPYIDDMTIVDDYTIIFHLNATTALFFSQMLEMKLVPNGFLAASDENGCGPFILGDEATMDIGGVSRTTRTILANEDYFNGRPYMDAIVYTFYNEGFYDSVAHTGAGYDLLNGSVDIIGWDLTSNETASTIIQIPRSWGMNSSLANPDEKNTTIHTETGLQYRYLGMNTARDHILNDANVRMAIGHIVNKKALVNYDISGGLVVADSIINPEITPWFNTNLMEYENDRAMSNAILDDAGYFDIDGDGYREMPDGSDFQFEMLIPTQEEDISALSMGNDLSNWINSIGIHLVINMTLDEGARMTRVLADDFDFFLSTETRGTIDPGFMYDLFHSEMVSTTNENHNMFNFEGRHREYYGVVSVNNTTMVGQMNHTNVFDDDTANITAYRNGEEWGVTTKQEVWEVDTTPLPVDMDLLNVSINDDYRIYRNRSVNDEITWSVNLNPVQEVIHDVPVTEVTGEVLVTVNTSARPGRFVAATNRSNVIEETVTINAGPPADDLLNFPVETGTVELWKESDTSETFSPTSLAARNVLLVDADTYDENLIAYYQSHIVNNSDTCDVWDVYGHSGPAQGNPTAVDMAPYNIVVWVIDRGYAYEGVTEFTAAEEAQVATYLDGGGNFFISGIYYAEQSGTTPGDPVAGDFAYDYLGIDAVNPNSGNEVSVVGVAADAVFNGWGPCFLDWGFWFGMGYFGWDSDDFTPTPAGIGCVENDDGGGTTAIGGVRMEGGSFKTVTFGFPFDALDGACREDAMARILNYFVPAGGGSSGQLPHGALANETIIDYNVWDDTAAAYLTEPADYTLNPDGSIDFVTDLSGNTIIVFYNYTTTMVEGTDYLNLNAWHYENGKVNTTIPYNAAEDAIKANYTWYGLDKQDLALDIDADGETMEIRDDNYVIWWDNGGAPAIWGGGNYNLDTVTGVITFTSPLGPGETVTADYTLFNPKFYDQTFTFALDHGAGVDGMNIALADFHLMKNGVDMGAGEYTLDDVQGTFDIELPGVLTYNDILTADYWYYDPTDMPGGVAPFTFQLTHGAGKDGNECTEDPLHSSHFVSVLNEITGIYTNYTVGGANADLVNGAFDLPVYNPGDEATAFYMFYDPTEIVYAYDIANAVPNDALIVEGTFSFFLNNGLISKSNYQINYTSGHIVLNQVNVPLGPHDVLTADYYYWKDLAQGGGGFSIDADAGVLTINGGVQLGDWIYADYTYETYEILGYENGTIRVLANEDGDYNLDVANDTLTMSFDYRRFDELIEKSNMQMNYDDRAEYIKDAQAFIAEEIPCIPLFSSKVANAFNNTRYEGWDAGSMPGGILNFWMFTNVRNKILGDMQVTISAFPGYVTEGEDIDLVVRVEDLDGNAIPEAELEFDGSGTYGTPEWDETGETYTVTYTAPPTSISRTVTITATAVRPSYVMGSGQVQLTVHPVIREFDIEITRGATSLDSGNQTDITIAVRDKDTQEVVSDAELAISVSPLGLGGSMQDATGITDGAGEFATVFIAANVTIDTTFTISVTASKDGYVDETQTSSISVNRDPDIAGASRGFLGLPAPPIFMILILLGCLSVFYAGYRRKRR